jgi:hypothetical protein
MLDLGRRGLRSAGFRRVCRAEKVGIETVATHARANGAEAVCARACHRWLCYAPRASTVGS